MEDIYELDVEFEENKQKFLDIIEFEFNKFYKDISQKSPKEILRLAYEYMIKSEIYEQLFDYNFDKEEYKELVKKDSIIDDIYQYYLDSDYQIYPVIEDTLDDYIDDTMDKIKQKYEVKKEKEAR